MISKINQERLLFTSDVRKRWVVKRDQNYDPYIVLNGRHALGNDGFDHIFIISESRVGVWLTSEQIKQKIAALQKKLPELLIEQLGDREAVISADKIHLGELCRVARAKRRRQLTEAQRQRLLSVNPLIRRTCPAKLGGNAVKIAERHLTGPVGSGGAI